MSEDNLRAARILARSGQYRSAATRSYYSAYCAITEEIRKHITVFPYGWNNPPHLRVTNYIYNNTTLSPVKKSNIALLIDTLRLFREDADYRPSEDIDFDRAKDCIRDAMQVQIELWGYCV